MLLVSCGGKKDKGADAGVATGYTFGAEQTFRSDEKVNYSIFFSDASWYPKLESWESEGVFKDIENLTNVHLDLTSSSVHRDRGAEIIQIIYKNGVVKNLLDREIGMSYDDFIKTLLDKQDKEETDRIFRMMAALKSVQNE
jgi:hypothetical protein